MSLCFLIPYKWRSGLTLAPLVLLLLVLAAPAHAEVKVLASIKPLGLIAERVAGDRAAVDVLLPPGASPHDYPLRASDMRRINSADLVVWVGPELESFLKRPLRGVGEGRLLTAQDLDGLHWPAEPEHLRHGGDHAGRGEAHAHDHDRDPHLWLDPRNAARLAGVLADTLAGLDAEGASLYRDNAAAFAEQMRALDAQLAERLAPVADKGFAVYHEGYAHFVARYNLNQLAYVTYTPERLPGARHMYQLRQQLDGQAHCLFAEPYYDMRAAERLAGELDMALGLLDPLGALEVERYEQIPSRLADELLACLAGEGKL